MKYASILSEGMLVRKEMEGGVLKLGTAQDARRLHVKERGEKVSGSIMLPCSLRKNQQSPRGILSQ